MENQLCTTNYTGIEAENNRSVYNWQKAERRTDLNVDQPKKMRVLFSGNGKAERNLGMAAIPPLWIPGPPAWRD